MNILKKSFLFLFLLVIGIQAKSETYVIDPVHSYIGFSVKHMVISQVKGNFNQFKGTIYADRKKPTRSSVAVEITASSINTNNQKRDKDLRSKAFLLTEKYPTIRFKSRKIVKSKKKNRYTIIGDLTIRGITKKVKLPFAFLGKVKDPWGNIRAGFSAKTKINRKDFGLTFNKVLDNGGLVVGKTVEIEIRIEAVKAK